ncbi:MAG TPA: ATP-binding protein [Acidobacteriota bacterium]|nr:ATP-binding protein [Acidobacteriota bacterium]
MRFLKRGLLLLVIPLIAAFLYRVEALAQDREAVTSGHVLDLSGPWKFHTGDDLRWAAPGFDDRVWPTLQVPEPWGRQGYGGYSGIAWYRLTLRIPPPLQTAPLGLVLGFVDSSYQLYAGGLLLGGVGQLPPSPRMEYDRRQVFPIPARAFDSQGRLVLAVRVWKNAGANRSLGGLYHGTPRLGPTDAIVRQELLSQIPHLLLSALFLLVGLYHIHLYRSRRELKEYLWYGTLAAFNAAVYTFFISQWRFEISNQYVLMKKIEYLAAFTAPAVFVQFLWPMLGRAIGRPLRAYQYVNLAFALAAVLAPDLSWNREMLPYWYISLVTGGVICICLVLLEAHRGVTDARTISMGILLFLAALGNDILADRGWIQSVRLMPLGFAAFLGSMALSLVNRFTRVHAELSALKHDLEQRVQARTYEVRIRSAELSDANQKLAERSRELAEASVAKSQFLANMSHELRTPLNAIIGYSEILLEEAHESGQGESITDLKKIHVAGRHLLALINEVLDLSKIEAGKMELYLERFPVSAMLEDLASTMSPLVEKNRNRLEIHCPAEVDTMFADARRVRQVLLNLLSNACKFTEDGVISLEAEKFGGLVCLRVRDTGIGMTRDQIDRLFQAFMQADASVTRKYGGTGLGLVISKRFCQMMGGDLTVQSEYGKGSTFLVTLPEEVTESRPELTMFADARLEANARAATDGGGIVLVIDDDRSARDLMVRLISKEGVRVVTAWGGEEGLRLARELHPSIITLDVLMPGMDGRAVLRELKSDPELASIPVIMITMEEDRSFSQSLGASDFLIKPIQKDELMAVLNKYRKQ